MKHVSGVVVMVLALLLVSVKAEAISMSDTFMKLANQKSLSSKFFFNGNFNTTNSSQKKDYLDIKLTNRGDTSTPGAIKADNSFSVSTDLLAGLGLPRLDFTVNTRLVGETIYIQIPNLPIEEIDPELKTLVSPYINQWVRINKSDLQAIAQDSSEIDLTELTESFDKISATNSQPVAQTLELRTFLKKFDKIFSFRKSGSRVMDGIVQDRYIITINKTNLINLIASEGYNKDTTMSKEEKAYRIKDAKDSIANINFKSVLIYVGQKDNLPYQFTAIIENLEKKKVTSTMKFNLVFSQYGSRFDDIVAPAQFKTLTELYFNVFKPSLEEARIKGTKASLNANISYFRAQAELTYDLNNDQYGTMANNGSCINPIYGSVFNPTSNSSPSMDNYGYNDSSSGTKNLLESINSSSSAATCNSTTKAWALQATYKGTSGLFCADSTGIAKETRSSLVGTACGN